MGFKCCYPGCKTGKEVIRNGVNAAVTTTSLFKFPQAGSEQYNLWARYVNRPELPSNPRFCADHFLAEDVLFQGKRNVLAQNAVPCIQFDPNQSITVLTTTKGEHFMDHVPKTTKLDFRETVGNIDPSWKQTARTFLTQCPNRKKIFVKRRLAAILKSTH